MDDKIFFMDKTKPVTKIYEQSNLVDIDTKDLEESNYDFKYSSVDLNKSKIEYHKKLLLSLHEEREKTCTKDINLKPKCNRQTVSIKTEIPIKGKSQVSDDLNLSNSKINYRTICEDSNMMKDCFLSSSRCNAISFRSLSRQSLNESINDCGLTSTASRISANLMKHNMDKPSINHEMSTPISKPYVAITNRRYRTVTRKDRFSSYLSREVASDGNIFSISSVTSKNGNTSNSQVPLMLNLSNTNATMNERGKRLDFSKIFQSSLFDKGLNQDILQCNSSSRSNSVNILNRSLGLNWKCTSCDTDNACNFNFCPNCSQPNPKLLKQSSPNILDKLSGKLDVSGNSYDWMCSRCSTRNDAIRTSCLFCFKSKESLKTDYSNRRRLSDSEEEGQKKKRKIVENVILKETEITEDTEKKLVENNEDKEGKLEQKNESENLEKSTNTLIQSNKLEIPSEFQKWSCPGCWVENPIDLNTCPCCMTKNPSLSIIGTCDKNQQVIQCDSLFSFGSSSNVPLSSTSVKLTASPITFKFGNENNVSVSTMIGNSTSNKWTCPGCWVENAEDAKACVCCSYLNPISNYNSDGKSMTEETQNESFSAPILFGSCSATDEKKSLPFQFGSFPNTSKDTMTIINEPNKDKIGKWNCPTCLVDNSPNAERCVCCQETNPSSKSFEVNGVGSAEKFLFPKVVNTGFSFHSSATSNSNSSTTKFRFGSVSDPQSIAPPKFHFGTELNGHDNTLGVVEEKKEFSIQTTVASFFPDRQCKKTEDDIDAIVDINDNSKFIFKKPESLALSIDVEVPVDLVFQFSCPIKL